MFRFSNGVADEETQLVVSDMPSPEETQLVEFSAASVFSGTFHSQQQTFNEGMNNLTLVLMDDPSPLQPGLLSVNAGQSQQTETGGSAATKRKPRSRQKVWGQKKPKKVRKSIATKPKSKPAKRTKAVRIPKPKAEKKRKDTTDDLNLDGIEFQDVNPLLKDAFSWPTKLTQCLNDNFTNKLPDRVHVQLWTEFSGAGTPEVALEALGNAYPGLSMGAMSTGDWDVNAKLALVANTPAKTHIFGEDISKVLPAHVKEQCDKRVPVEAS